MENPFVASDREREALDRVYHFFVDKDGKETGEYEEFRLASDGSVDLSSMRDQRRAETWSDFGIRGSHGFDRVLPKEGERFLQALLRMNNQNWRFRRSA